MTNTIKYLYPQAELTDREIVTLSRRARRFAGNPPNAAVYFRPETYWDTVPWGERVQKIRLSIWLEFQDQQIQFYALRCGNCGRLILHHPEADAVCPYKGCDCFAAGLR